MPLTPAASMTHRFGGWIVVYNKIPALIAAVEVNSRAAVKKKAEDIARDAKGRAPVQTGFLRSSIHAVSVAEGKSAEVQVDAPYAPFVEYGTYKMAARPFLSPAVAAHVDDFKSEVGRGVTFGW